MHSGRGDLEHGIAHSSESDSSESASTDQESGEAIALLHIIEAWPSNSTVHVGSRTKLPPSELLPLLASFFECNIRSINLIECADPQKYEVIVPRNVVPGIPQKNQNTLVLLRGRNNATIDWAVKTKDGVPDTAAASQFNASYRSSNTISPRILKTGVALVLFAAVLLGTVFSEASIGYYIQSQQASVDERRTFLFLMVVVAASLSFLLNFCLWIVRELCKREEKLTSDEMVSFKRLLGIEFLLELFGSTGVTCLLFFEMPYISMLEFSILVLSGLAVPYVVGCVSRSCKKAMLLVALSLLWLAPPVAFVILWRKWNILWVLLASVSWIPNVVEGFGNTTLPRRYARTSWSSFWRLVFLLVAFAGLSMFFNGHPSLEAFFEDIASIFSPYHRWALLFHSLGSLAAFVGAWISLSMGLGRWCFSVPLALARVILVVLCLPSVMVWVRCNIFTQLCSGDFDNILAPSPWYLWLIAALQSFMYLIGIILPQLRQHEDGIGLRSESSIWTVLRYAPLFGSVDMPLNRPRRTKVAKKAPAAENPPTLRIVCPCFWHENEEEIRNALQNMIRVAHENFNDRLEFHVMFDDAFKQGQITNNSYVMTLHRALESFGISVSLDQISCTPYGAVHHTEILSARTRTSTPLIIHYKDNSKVYNRKRWSHVLVITEILQRFLEPSESQNMQGVDLDHIFFLFCDGDTRFSKLSMDLLQADLVKNDDVGASCGRIYPEGSSLSLLLLYQKFEFASGQWLNKATEHVFGSILCCAGPLTMVRASAMLRKPWEQEIISESVKDCVLAEYAKQVETGEELLQFDLGEDRAFTSLLITAGWRTSYNSLASAYCRSPSDIGSFLNQRRRWLPSTLMNTYLLTNNGKDILRNNKSFSFMFFFYVLAYFVTTFLGPATVSLLFMDGWALAFPNAAWIGIVAGIGIPAFYWLACWILAIDPAKDSAQWKTWKQAQQVLLAKICFYFLSLIQPIAFVGTVLNLASHPLSAALLFFMFSVAVALVCAILHGEIIAPLCGVFYIAFMPFTVTISAIYSAFNVNDSSWGLREDPSNSGKASWRAFFKKFWPSLRTRPRTTTPVPSAASTSADSIPSESSPLAPVSALLSASNAESPLPAHRNSSILFHAPLGLKFDDSKNMSDIITSAAGPRFAPAEKSAEFTSSFAALASAANECCSHIRIKAWMQQNQALEIDPGVTLADVENEISRLSNGEKQFSQNMLDCWAFAATQNRPVVVFFHAEDPENVRFFAPRGGSEAVPNVDYMRHGLTNAVFLFYDLRAQSKHEFLALRITSYSATIPGGVHAPALAGLIDRCRKNLARPSSSAQKSRRENVERNIGAELTALRNSSTKFIGIITILFILIVMLANSQPELQIDWADKVKAVFNPLASSNSSITWSDNVVGLIVIGVSGALTLVGVIGMLIHRLGSFFEFLSVVRILHGSCTAPNAVDKFLDRYGHVASPIASSSKDQYAELAPV